MTARGSGHAPIEPNPSIVGTAGVIARTFRDSRGRADLDRAGGDSPRRRMTALDRSGRGGLSRPPLMRIGMALLAAIFLRAVGGGGLLAAAPLPKGAEARVLRSPRFNVHFPAGSEAMARQAARMAERWSARFERLLGRPPEGRRNLVMSASPPLSGPIVPVRSGPEPGWEVAPRDRRIVISLAPTLADTDRSIGRALFRDFADDLTGIRVALPLRPAGSLEELVPFWLLEGLTRFYTRGPVDTLASMWLRDAVRRHNVPGFETLPARPAFPNLSGHAAVAFIAGRAGEGALPRILRQTVTDGNWQAAIAAETGLSIDELSGEWAEASARRYGPLLEAAGAGREVARALGAGRRDARDRVSPAIGPDGRLVAFLSSSDTATFELLLADAGTGRVLHRLDRVAAGRYRQSPAVLPSGGWTPEGDRFCHPAVREGRPALIFFDARTGLPVRTIDVPGLDFIADPDVSPDGRRIVLSGMRNGSSDLYLLDLETGGLEQLTDDIFGDLRPAWSPDGRTIAFMTERFRSDLERLRLGGCGLACLDAGSGTVTELPGFPEADHLDPCWTPDGRGLYFLSDPGGFSNVFRLDLGTGRIDRLTGAVTGIRGVSDLAPALSAARQAGDLAFSRLENERFEICVLSPDGEIAAAAGPAVPPVNAAILPPWTGPEGQVSALLRDFDFGLIANGGEAGEVEDYRPRLGLDPAVPEGAVPGTGRFGIEFGNGLGLFLSDVLDYHVVALAIRLDLPLVDSSALVSYAYTKYKWLLGLSGQRVPYVSSEFAEETGTIDGRPAEIRRQTILRQITSRVLGRAVYPLSYESRLELGAGFESLAFERELRVRAFSPGTDVLLRREDRSLASPSGLALATALAAVVKQGAFVGLVSPTLGEAYRMEVTGHTGDLSFVTAMADYRRYSFLPAPPFTLAFRALHFGRYGTGAADDRLTPLFIGYPNLVRGYNVGPPGDAALAASGIEALNRWSGDRLLALNLEFRFPFFYALGIGPGYYGPLPLEMYAFVDAGLAWEGWDLRLLGNGRRSVVSAGAGLRANILGVIAGVHLVYPFDRPDRGWHFQFSFAPGL